MSDLFAFFLAQVLVDRPSRPDPKRAAIADDEPRDKRPSFAGRDDAARSEGERRAR